MDEEWDDVPAGPVEVSLSGGGGGFISDGGKTFTKGRGFSAKLPSSKSGDWGPGGNTVASDDWEENKDSRGGWGDAEAQTQSWKRDGRGGSRGGRGGRGGRRGGGRGGRNRFGDNSGRRENDAGEAEDNPWGGGEENGEGSWGSRRGGSSGRRGGRGGVHFNVNNGNDDEWGGGGGSGAGDGWGDDNAEEESRPSRGRGRGGSRGGGRGGRGGRRGGGNGDSGWSGNGQGDGDTEEGEKPKREIYIPPEPTNDENEMFSSGNTTGVNFAKYDEIEVQVSGENYPRPISSFEGVGLRELLIENVKKSGYKKPTPIQKYSIPIILAGRDLMACAQTGSGKTAAFLLPIIHILLAEPKDLVTDGTTTEPQAVIVSPTRELAIQIYEEARKFSHNSIIKTVVAYGGTSVSYQRDRMKIGCHILVATPGRMNDFVKKGTLSFNSTRFIVLDEADRMLDMGFLPDIEQMMDHQSMVPTGTRQTLMFSATFPEDIQRLAAKFLDNYIFVAVGIVGGACTDVDQRFYQVDKFKKREKLIEILNEEGSEKTLVFVETKRNADFIALFLCENDFPTTSIHGDRLQRQREEALRDFKTGLRNILVATGVAARGLDIKNVRHVINYDLPKSIDEYVHRIGRTGRVGNRGKATSFYDEAHDAAIAGDLARILKQAGQPVPDWLKGGSSRNLDNGAFGGRDVREDDFGLASADTNVAEEPDEAW